MTSPSSSAITVSEVPGERQFAALEWYFQNLPEEERTERVTAALTSVQNGVLSLRGLREAQHEGKTVGMSLSVLQPDGICQIWRPRIAESIEEVADVQAAGQEILETLLKDLVHELDHSDARLGQVVLDVADERMAEAFRTAGFTQETRLYFLARSLQQPLPVITRPVQRIPYREELAEIFANVLERTYIDSLDCRLLEGLRNSREALSSHQLSGVFRPEYWQLFMEAGELPQSNQPIGLCLLNDHPDQQAVELVYLGVVPEFRGKGWGLQLLVESLQQISAEERAAVFLAVDAENTFASDLYGRMNFAELAHRRVLFRFARHLARQSSTSS